MPKLFPTPPILGLLGALMLIPAGCSRQPILTPEDPPPDPVLTLEEPPDDFALAVTVYSPVRGRLEETPRVVRPARYIVEPDGVLRTSVGPGAREDTFPPITRRLSEDQIRTLWIAVRDSGLLDGNSTARVRSGADAEPVALAVTDPSRTVEPDGPGASTAVIYIAHSGERAWYSVRLDGPGVASDPLATLSGREIVERLADLSWMRP